MSKYTPDRINADGYQGRGKIDGSRIIRSVGGYRQTEDGRYFFLGFQGFVQANPEKSRHLHFCLAKGA